MTQKNRHILAFIVGILLTILMRWLQPKISASIVGELAQDGAMHSTMAMTSIVVAQILTLLPGFIVGWIACTYGTGLAFIAVFVGTLFATLIFGGMQDPAYLNRLLSNRLSWEIGRGIGDGLVAAAAGAAGQLLGARMSSKGQRSTSSTPK
jgi:hypothetical protein